MWNTFKNVEASAASFLKAMQHGIVNKDLLHDKCNASACAVASTIDRAKKIATYTCQTCGHVTTKKLGETG